jgi:hypothetical protein
MLKEMGLSGERSPSPGPGGVQSTELDELGIGVLYEYTDPLIGRLPAPRFGQPPITAETSATELELGLTAAQGWAILQHLRGLIVETLAVDVKIPS